MGAPVDLHRDRGARADPWRHVRGGLQLWCELVLDPRGVHLHPVRGRERGRLQDRAVERDHGGHPADHEFPQCGARAHEGLLPVLSPHDEFGQEGVVLGGHHGSGTHSGVHAHPRARGGLERLHRAGRGEEAEGRVLRIESELERVPPRLRVLGEAQRQTVGHAELFPHEVHARRLLRDGVFHLQPRVDLQEGDQPVRGHEVLDRARSGVPGLPADGTGGFVDGRALLIGQERRRGLLHELLVPPLQ